MWGIFFGEFQCLPVNDCSAVSCDSSALARGSESTSFYSTILNQSSLIYFIYLFLSVLGLHCCAQAFSSCDERGLLFVAVHGPLTVVASLVAEHGLQVCGLQQLWYAGSVVVAHGL